MSAGGGVDIFEMILEVVKCFFEQSDFVFPVGHVNKIKRNLLFLLLRGIIVFR